MNDNCLCFCNNIILYRYEPLIRHDKKFSPLVPWHYFQKPNILIQSWDSTRQNQIRNILQGAWLLLFKNVRVIRTKGKTENVADQRKLGHRKSQFITKVHEFFRDLMETPGESGKVWSLVTINVLIFGFLVPDIYTKTNVRCSQWQKLGREYMILQHYHERVLYILQKVINSKIKELI